MHKLTTIALSTVFPAVVAMSLAAANATVRAGDLTPDTPLTPSSLTRQQVQAELLRERAEAPQPLWADQHDPLRLGGTKPRFAAAMSSAAPEPAERRADARACAACGEDSGSFALSRPVQSVSDHLVVSNAPAQR